MAVKLNPSQQAAVEHDRGPLLVLAGAGSGKTGVITRRIMRLIEKGARPEAILAVSFTNKAAGEMKERMVPLVGRENADKLWLSTFHSFGVRFLREESSALGFDRFVIFDQGDTVGLVRELVKARGGDRNLDVMSILTRISLWKNASLAPGEVKTKDFEYDIVAREVYPLYQEKLASMHAVDFDDLVVAPMRILKEREDIRNKWRARFRYLLIDEFQDTNKCQLDLVRQLASDEHNVCVVGDDDQSIYGWRGAEVGNILDFERYFPGTRVVKLETNYRSKAPIIAVANAVIGQSRGQRHAKTLISARGEGPKVRVLSCMDAAAETKFVTREIRELNKGGHASPDDKPILYKNMAVLYRSNTQARLLEEELRIAGIPYRLFGGTQFFDRKEIKDVVAYLRVIDNPLDELSLRRIINTPSRGIGDATLKKVRTFSILKGIPFYQGLRRIDELDIAPSTRQAVGGFFAALDEARRSFDQGESLVATTEQLMQRVGFTRSINEDDSSHGQRRRENYSYLLRALRRFEEGGKRKLSLGQFLTRLMLRVEQEEEDAGNQVTLSSLHSSKGLEFGVVFLIGCVEGQLPHSRTTDPKVTEAAPTDVEEERRLFYVGVTRARDLLYLTRPERRILRGKVTPRVPSRFLDGFPDGAWEPYKHSGEETMSSDEVQDMTANILARLRGES